MKEWWTNWPWRLIQTNLREIDMQDIDAERYAQEMKAFKATIAMINTSGIIASYTTKLQHHFQSPHLTGDSLEDIIEACHRENIKVFARTDFSKIRRPIYEAHPEWAYVSPQGKIVDYNGDVHACINGGYQQGYALKIIEETITTLDLDGIFFNMGGYQVKDYSGNYYGPCQCKSCQRRFMEMYGLSLPQVEDWNDPVFQKYMVFKRETARAHKEKTDALIHKLRSDMCIDKSYELKDGFVRQESNTAVDRPLPNWQYSGSDNTKWVVSSYPYMVSSNTTVDFIDIPYRHVMVSPHQQRLRLYQNLANGGAVDYYLIGRLDDHQDKSGYGAVKEVFHYHADHEEDYRDLVSKANIALLKDRFIGNQAEFRGWFRFLAESHYPFDSLIVDEVERLPLDRYDAIIIPDYEPIGDGLAEVLDKFVSAGGTIIATAQSGFRNGDYEPRQTPALSCLGIERVRSIKEKMRSAYLKMGNKEGFEGFPETNLLYIDGKYVYADYNDKVQKRFQLIPPHHYGPPERCYWQVVTQNPGFTINSFGKGKGIYIPWNPGWLYHRQGHTNTLDFAADLLENIAGLRPIKGNLSPMVEVTLFEKKDGNSQYLHLVNTSGHFGVTYFAPVPMRDLEVSLEYTGTPKIVTSLATGKNCTFEVADGHLAIRIEKLDHFDGIRITGES